MNGSNVFGLLLFPLFVAFFATASAQDLVHPGGLHTRADLDRMRLKVAAGESPWIDGWHALLRDPKASADYKPAPQRHMINRGRAQNDANAAYLNALRWQISGDTLHGDAAARILDAWSHTVNEVPRGNDQPGLGGIPIGTFAIAAELLRDYPGWGAADQSRFKRMLLEYFYPVCRDFLVRHNGTKPDHYWANWDTCNMRAIMAIGVFCDDRAKFDEAVEYFKNGQGNGSIRHVAPFRHEGGLAQWQESGRDQAHVMGGMGLLLEMCQIAWNQGLDLFGYDNDLLLASAEYTAQYTLWKGVPYTYYNNSSEARQYYVSQNYHGRLDSAHHELAYNHYVVRQGLKAPHVQLFAELRRPEHGEIDVLGYGTLVYTLDAAASPLPSAIPPTPRDVTAVAGLGRVELGWPPSGAYNAHGYEIARATSAQGPFDIIYSTTRWTTPAYTDIAVEPGQTYHYTVAALNTVGKSEASTPLAATPVAGGALPSRWRSSATADAKLAPLYTPAAGGSFLVPAVETDSSWEGVPVSIPVKGDFVLTARLVQRTGPVALMGLVVRETGRDPSRLLAITLGEIGGRQMRFRTRADNKDTSCQLGNDFTWLPVWVRISRAGDTFTAFQSSDGIDWFQVGSTTASFPRGVHAGLMVTAQDNTRDTKKDDLPQGLFDHVTILRKSPMPPSAPAALTTTYLGAGVVRLAWPGSSIRAGIKVEASLDGAPFCEIADLTGDATRFDNTGLRDPSAIRYRIRAYNRSGYSAYTEIVAGKTAPSSEPAPNRP